MRLAKAWDRYSAADRGYRLLTRVPIVQGVDPASPLAHALRKEVEALAENLQVLRDLAGFAPEGKLPDRQLCQR
jgi:hypothetical protein